MIDDFEKIGKNVPVLANLKPHGDYLMYHLHQIGGISIIMKKIQEFCLLYDECLTINGNTVKENLEGINHKQIFDTNPDLLKNKKF